MYQMAFMLLYMLDHVIRTMAACDTEALLIGPNLQTRKQIRQLIVKPAVIMAALPL